MGTTSLLLQSHCIEQVKSKAREIFELAPTHHPEAITRLVSAVRTPWMMHLGTTGLAVAPYLNMHTVCGSLKVAITALSALLDRDVGRVAPPK